MGPRWVGNYVPGDIQAVVTADHPDEVKILMIQIVSEKEN